MQTTTVTTMAIVSPTDSAAASLKRSCVAAICFLWRSSLSSCKGTLLELRIEAVVTKERIERRKEHKKHDFGIFYICIRSMNHHKNDRKARYTSRSRGYCRNFRLAFYINYAITVDQPADRVFDIKSQEIVTPIAVNLLRDMEK